MFVECYGYGGEAGCVSVNGGNEKQKDEEGEEATWHQMPVCGGECDEKR